MRTRVKICCIASIEEAGMAVDAGADALGLVGRMPSGPGTISDERIKEIAAATPPGVDSFLLTSETRADAVVQHVTRCHPSVVQLVDRVEARTYDELRQRCPRVRIVQVIHVTGPDAVELATALASEVDALLLDSGRPAAEVPELGGTGRPHDWSLSRRIVESSPVPVFLAGGLNPDNVTDAIRRVRPYGVDLCSGLRPRGELDSALLKHFMSRVREATAT